MIKPTLFCLFLLTSGFCSLAQTDYYGEVSAIIIGPNESTPETLWERWKPGQIKNFWTTVKIVEVKNGLDANLKGRKIKLLTQPFSKSLVGQTVSFHVRQYKPPSEWGEFRVTCCDLAGAIHVDRSRDNLLLH